MTCPCCPHEMLLHDGDGDDDWPYQCSLRGCGCVWVVGLDGSPERLHPNDD